MNFVNRLIDCVDMLGMHFACSKCKIIPQNWNVLNPEVVHRGEQLNELGTL